MLGLDGIGEIALYESGRPATVRRVTGITLRASQLRLIRPISHLHIMQNAAPLPLEEACIRAERHYRVLDTPREDVFDRITELAAHFLDVPMAGLGFADCERIWFKSTYGLDLFQVGRASRLFSPALETEGVFQIADLRLERGPVGRRRPDLPEWRFIAGIALRCPEGNAFGGLWLVDERPRRLNAEEEVSLRHLSAMVVELLELRRRARAASESGTSRLAASFEAGARITISKDEATGLPNRATFIERLDQSLEQSRRRADHSFAVLLLDIDRFKVINESLGRAAGDRLLAAAAERLHGSMRPGDIVARLGGDEFAVLARGIRDPCDATHVADRIQRCLGEPVDLDGGEIVTAVSIGIVMSRDHYQGAAEVLRDAEIAMHRAKVGGRARHVLFDPDMHVRAVARLQLESELRHALERGELELYYQPLVELSTGRFFGLEALLRWRHPTRGMLSPGSFLDVAEETGLIVPIGSWVLREACRQAREWNAGSDSAPRVMSINLSALQIKEETLPSEVHRVLEEVDLDPALLWLEITENMLLRDREQTVDVLSRLSSLGVRICLDDFGSGYSAMAYLAQLPLDVLKIDRCFVHHLDATENREIVRAVAALARRLDLRLVVEGVESLEQLSVLRQLGCEYLQGYLLAPPLPASEVADLLAISDSPEAAETA